MLKPGGPDMPSTRSTHPPPQKWHCKCATDMPAVAARPVYTCRIQAMGHTADGRCVIASSGRAEPACQGVATHVR